MNDYQRLVSPLLQRIPFSSMSSVSALLGNINRSASIHFKLLCIVSSTNTLSSSKVLSFAFQFSNKLVRGCLFHAQPSPDPRCQQPLVNLMMSARLVFQLVSIEAESSTHPSPQPASAVKSTGTETLSRVRKL